MIKNYIMFGAPGVGKGTIAEKISQATGAVHISTGVIFRNNIKEKTPIGKEVKSVLDSGGYVPDELTNRILLDAITKENVINHGYILDGYPRTEEQVKFLNKHTSSAKCDLKIIILSASQDVVTERLLARGRIDDIETTIRKRFKIYEQETKPILKFYRDNMQEAIIDIDSSDSVEEVWKKIKSEIGI